MLGTYSVFKLNLPMKKNTLLVASYSIVNRGVVKLFWGFT